MSLWADFIDVLRAKLKSPFISINLAFCWTGWIKSKKENPMPPKYKWFSPEKDDIGGLDEEFLAKLDQARNIAGFPFVITSGFRTPEKNQSVIGAVSDSAHLKGLAVDLKVENSHEVYLIVISCTAVKIARFGIYIDQNNFPTHVHVDVDPEKVAEVVWIKREGQATSSIESA